MEYLQYFVKPSYPPTAVLSFKPCYKWNTFNTRDLSWSYIWWCLVLNLVISGIPSILLWRLQLHSMSLSFKPCYKWNTFNTGRKMGRGRSYPNGFKPCYKWNTFNTSTDVRIVPEVHSFKPCYKWNTFNTTMPDINNP